MAFIGSNFVHDWLAANDETVINLDKLTYAGNLENLASRHGPKDFIQIQRELGCPAETFESGIHMTVQWYLDNPEWVANVQSVTDREWVAKQYQESNE